ncbi:hypothetical protein FS842_003152 [Serendipita sp. 407]|nr:hypothetical protein FRC18_003895 [Serendipita sp. 400]KAG9039484.1 hypothetical protein FS842_003152 [Serendipita sp. 407]
MGSNMSLFSKTSLPIKFDSDTLVRLFTREDDKPTSTTLVTTLVAATAIVTLSYLYFRSSLQRRPKGLLGMDTFPSPGQHSLLGNIKNWPKDDWPRIFKEWQETYGDVICITFPHIHILVLNSLHDTEELFGKRANVWSARPDNKMVKREMDFGWSLLFMDTTNAFYETRKIFRKVLGPQAVPDYDHLIDLAAESFIQNLKGFEGDPDTIVKHAVGSVIIKVAYGDKIHRQYGEELIKVNGEMVEEITGAVTQLWLVNFFPWTRFLPSWTPGLSFPHYAKTARAVIKKAQMWGFSLVQEDVKKGEADLSVVSKYLNEPTFSEEYLRDGVAMMYFAGVDTTSSALMNFISIMLTYPEVQKKVHEELDQVAGKGVIPSVGDISSLKYLDAVWKETLRLIPPIPTGVPHTNAVDDIWRGVLIPKGTVVVPNMSFMLRDPRLWGNDADEFKPERFIPKHNPRWNELPDVHSIAFGFGRRVCPGRYMAERSWLMLSASVMAAYKVLPMSGRDDGTPVSVKYSTGQIQRPEHMECRFVARQ